MSQSPSHVGLGEADVAAEQPAGAAAAASRDRAGPACGPCARAAAKVALAGRSASTTDARRRQALQARPAKPRDQASPERPRAAAGDRGGRLPAGVEASRRESVVSRAHDGRRRPGGRRRPVDAERHALEPELERLPVDAGHHLEGHQRIAEAARAASAPSVSGARSPREARRPAPARRRRRSRSTDSAAARPAGSTRKCVGHAMRRGRARRRSSWRSSGGSRRPARRPRPGSHSCGARRRCC